ncbi:MAG: zinc ribbon domain-containing protein [Gammaproteobacteria bacterium]|nr:zinc ribbon domain-containing protein [Gammaproteobacteria bacterium]
MPRKKKRSDTIRHQFPCDNCGALQSYVPGTDHLQCPYCQHETSIPPSPEPIREYDLRVALDGLSRAGSKTRDADEPLSVKCDSCGSRFEFDQDIHSGACPYCGTPVVLKTDARPHRPESLLPFSLSEGEARQSFRRWIGKLWFAPNDLKRFARGAERMQGLYVPYWTYDSDTTTRYTGERGDAYQVPRQVTVVVNGRRTVQTRMETRIRWTPVSGRVSRFFDDVLVGATNTLPRKITDGLAPWDLQNLEPYREEYLSGFSSQLYQVDLDEGFAQARRIMDGIIRADIARDIGGDAQRIHRLDTQHRNTTFKHLLLPAWSAGFRFKGKAYEFAVNGRTGKVLGDRPYSPWKIGFAAVLALLLAAGAFWAWTEYEKANPGTGSEIYYEPHYDQRQDWR